ncbi:MAG: hypothetical protein IPM77_09520 [Crocinitomicaceae bacterium]|nr:hypothetical protein [Crocinitomicaceae bacterium]
MNIRLQNHSAILIWEHQAGSDAHNLRASDDIGMVCVVIFCLLTETVMPALLVQNDIREMNGRAIAQELLCTCISDTDCNADLIIVQLAL